MVAAVEAIADAEELLNLHQRTIAVAAHQLQPYPNQIAAAQVLPLLDSR